ncbi:MULTISPECIES: hypothetical protein [Enterobacteriaceae]|uniref:hypothetical protein n=1 Tax=Enterobacteriaceae TaxID=543 RepID=UPI001D2DB606|nr:MULTISPECIES: hypothetical protein [Enterobacteriaceae]EHR8187263.1 hypothetical protein [Salmonella enterica]HAW2012532.1 hypothetical protein [Escherichia coli]MCQ4367801.1 hypothetical protein [Enterobacter asburiae]MCW9337496.1 hypothetical protein [Klebsiella michiganensis]HBL6792792.1 hypothetical protein [Escherichia coli]
MKDITQVKNINPKNPENNNPPSQKVKTEVIKPNVILGMSVKRFLISSVITFFIIFLVILCSTVYLVKITISQTLSPTFLFFPPIVISIVLSMIYYWLPEMRAVINKVCDIGLTASVAIVSIVAISKPLGGSYFDSIVLNNNITSIIILSYIGVCSLTKTIVTIYPNSKRDPKHN